MNKNYDERRVRIACRALAALGAAALLGIVPAGSGINGGGRFEGSIDEFGSIFVNGVEFEIGGAAITIDGVPAVESDLRLGQVVTVLGAVNADEVTGSALAVAVSHDVRGAISAIDRARQTFTVLAQTVRVDGATLFGGALPAAQFAGLSVGQSVAVSGHRNATGELVAGRVDGIPGASQRVVGVVSATGPGDFAFRIGGLTVDYSAARIEAAIDVGARVSVEGVARSAGLLVAREVEDASAPPAEPGSAASLEGFVTAPLSGGRFALAGRAVQIDAATVFVDGSAADLVANVRAEAEGYVGQQGELRATQVTLVWPDVARAHGVVTRTPASGGVLEVNGLVVQVVAGTRFADERQKGAFGLADIRVGDTIEVRGLEPREPRAIRASSVGRVKPDGRTWIEGLVSGVDAGSIVLLDMPVLADSRTVYEDAAGRRLDAATFFAQAANREVKARGAYTGGSLVAAQLAFKN